ncbi:hypothetical protein N7478_012368 [Penicillium angulare]|uniref:uncharacterized protein n=1 Tax=Penicillium angulare TaxID=116970 RepID=UPI002540A202|nr:uncharacterized protein N7478_012368 [Penicillium angulare]KAJ5259387.1 hypothetical protein N7478_012368 [Penicillium angulare]
MTPGTGKRSYHLSTTHTISSDGVGEPKKAPCVACHESGSDCVLTKTRRGGNFRHYRTGSQTAAANVDDTAHTYTENISIPIEAESPDDGRSVSRNDSGDLLAMELRNPSDALHILAFSGDQPPARHSSKSPNAPTDPVVYGSMDTTSSLSQQSQLHTQSTVTIFDDYELVQRGILRPSIVSELLLKYSRYYHPYCPIIPPYLLRSSSTVKIQKPDCFLLTSILTIASRDDPQHSLIHRYCWDHIQRLLVDVLLARSWTQTPRTVEGLLILAEWLPHIEVQETNSGTPKNLFSEDRTAWSLLGLAVRHGYLQRLDQGAFRNKKGSESKERADQNRLLWAYIFMADRQISVRLGQSFWSRGPSLAAKFTARDFPTLQPCPENGSEDYASLLQASMELVQILHNAHAILYSSKERTLAMVYEGNYARYLDDFRIAVTAWHSTWSGLAVSSSIKSTLLIMYEYISLYTNAFSFQAVLTRSSDPQESKTQQHPSKHSLEGLLSNGIMASPDGRYIFDAISAAMNLLALINGLDPHRVIRYLPSRYYLYGVYAAVLLHKADCAGAFQSHDRRQEVTSLARDFMFCLEKAPSTEVHICHSYSRMLKQLWTVRERRTYQSSAHMPQSTSMEYLHSQRPTVRDYEQSTSPDNFNPSELFDSFPGGDVTAAFPSIEGYLLGSFMPGLADFSSPGLEDEFSQQYSFGQGFQDWGSSL